MSQVWAIDGGLLPVEKLVLLALADCADDLGRNSFPSVRKLAEKSNSSSRTVQRALRKLTARGLLEVEKEANFQRKIPTVYRLVLPPLTEWHGSVAGPLSPVARTPDIGDAEPVTLVSPGTIPPTVNQPENRDSEARRVLNAINRHSEILPRGLSPIASNLKEIQARLADGRTVEDLLTIVEHRAREARGKPETKVYFHPRTMFRASNFERNLNYALSAGPRSVRAQPAAFISFADDPEHKARMRRREAEEKIVERFPCRPETSAANAPKDAA